jgi:hypothetical protein
MDNSKIIVYAILFQLILVILIISSAFFSSESGLFSTFKKIPSTAYIITATSILLTYMSIQSASFKEACTVGFNIVDRAEKHIFEEFVKYHDEVPVFIDSMQFKIDKPKPKPRIPNTAKQDIVENYISTLIFQSVEDYIISAVITDLSDKEWFIMFTGWFQSDILIELWKKSYINFAEYTVKYINTLIDFCKQNNSSFTSYDKINEICGSFVLSPNYPNLLKKEDKYNISFKGY